MSAPNVFLLLAESFRTKHMPQHLYGISTYQHLEYTTCTHEKRFLECVFPRKPHHSYRMQPTASIIDRAMMMATIAQRRFGRRCRQSLVAHFFPPFPASPTTGTAPFWLLSFTAAVYLSLRPIWFTTTHTHPVARLERNAGISLPLGL